MSAVLHWGAVLICASLTAAWLMFLFHALTSAHDHPDDAERLPGDW